MPAILGHYLLALRMLDGKEDFQTETGRPAFLLGAQGEAFLCEPRHPLRREENPLRAFADYIGGLSTAALLKRGEACRKRHPRQEEIIRAYLAGFLCHRVYLEEIGPFFRAVVSAYEQMEEEPGTRKRDDNLPARVEALFDILLLRYETGQLPFECSLKETWPREEALWQSVAQFYAQEVANEETGPVAQPVVLEAMENRWRILRLLNNRTTFKRSAIGLWEGVLGRRGAVTARMHPLTEPDGFDYANVAHAVWQDPLSPQKEREESLFALFERAAQRASLELDTYIKGGTLS